jgi:hypothetical protein
MSSSFAHTGGAGAITAESIGRADYTMVSGGAAVNRHSERTAPQSFIVVPDFPVTFQPENSHTAFPWLLG